MKGIQMVDLKSQYLKIKRDIDDEIQKVLNSTAFINGPQVKEFTSALNSFQDSKKTITCGNGTDALQIAMMALDFKPGQEVIVPAFTYVATVEVIALLQLKPVFIDVDPNTFNLDVDQLERKITQNTAGVVPVHLYGQCADMEPIMEIATRHNVSVIEDSAQALGSVYTFADGETHKAGTMGHIGTSSFFPSKNLGCYGDGGAIFTNDVELGEKIRMIANHGQKTKYYHDLVGVNSRLDTLQAAILKAKLRYLDDYALARTNVATYYDEKFKDIEGVLVPHRSKKSTHVFHQYTVKVENGQRDALSNYLLSKGIPTMIYYPLPLHLQKAYRGFGFKEGDFPIAERLCNEVISLPIHTEMTAEMSKYIADSVIDFFD